jgi:hypothetical protein
MLQAQIGKIQNRILIFENQWLLEKNGEDAALSAK